MAWTTSKYRIAAVVLWGSVSVVVGLSIGFYFNMSEKKILFVVVVAVGLYVLALLRTSGKKENEKQSVGNDESVDPFIHQTDLNKLSEGEKKDVIGKDIEENEGRLTENGSREWLDDFLVKQQRNP